MRRTLFSSPREEDAKDNYGSTRGRRKDGTHFNSLPLLTHDNCSFPPSSTPSALRPSLLQLELVSQQVLGLLQPVDLGAQQTKPAQQAQHQAKKQGLKKYAMTEPNRRHLLQGHPTDKACSTSATTTKQTMPAQQAQQQAKKQGLKKYAMAESNRRHLLQGRALSA